jgi:hypothetical protein
MLKHFKKGLLGDYGIKISPGRLHMLCELEWPTFEVNWPPEVTLNLPTVRAIYQLIIGTPGNPNQFPYIPFTPGFRFFRPCHLGSDSALTKRNRAEFLWPRQ